MHLPVAERGAVILKDVLGYSLEEIGHVMHATVPATKAALHRGRRHLRELAEAPRRQFVPVLAGPERSLLAAYVDRFNDHDFDAVREMLAEEVELEVCQPASIVGSPRGEQVFHQLRGSAGLASIPGFIDGTPGILVGDPADLKGRPTYFIVLNWSVGGIFWDPRFPIRPIRDRRCGARSVVVSPTTRELTLTVVWNDIALLTLLFPLLL